MRVLYVAKLSESELKGDVESKHNRNYNMIQAT